jgi:hypothetical protein
MILETFVSPEVKGAAPLGLPPPIGERGGHNHNYHIGLPNNIGIKDFYRAKAIDIIKESWALLNPRISSKTPGKKF